jgi:hypothetical protein
MNLDEWNALSPGERDERKRRWVSHVPVGQEPVPEGTEWQGLVMEAERRFLTQYGGLPEILSIGSSCSFDIRDPVAVLVRTRLTAGRYVREIPETFLSFPVRQEPLADEVAAFERTWSAVLSRLFDWPDGAIQEWIAGHEWVFRSVWFLHDTPLSFIPIIDLAHSVAGHRSRSDLRGIEEDLNRAIGINFYVDQEADYDWDEARKRIAKVLNKYRMD